MSKRTADRSIAIVEDSDWRTESLLKEKENFVSSLSGDEKLSQTNEKYRKICAEQDLNCDVLLYGFQEIENLMYLLIPYNQEIYLPEHPKIAPFFIWRAIMLDEEYMPKRYSAVAEVIQTISEVFAELGYSGHTYTKSYSSEVMIIYCIKHHDRYIEVFEINVMGAMDTKHIAVMAIPKIPLITLGEQR